MRAITVRQPWAWQIIHQGKDVENRTRNIAGKYRGPLAIHAALKPDREALARLPMRAPEWVTAPRIFDYGVILGVVDLVDVHDSTACYRSTDSYCCSEWAEPWDVQHLVLANPRPIPISEQPRCRGQLGLWTPPASILDQLKAVS
ncbi:hypothetical protein C5U48_12845 [Mycolicibacter virginiensis]|uniref:ASCH domain-containing protein n=1 Tax=Mycolicibacter virginiensis TaxID=1795032 RepID=A0A9X7IMJ0_9MYCO|nr:MULTISPECIES: ASCH domain-containing protein [Mycobacteriaceae]PQM51808.1 hypothetical protein C5U48_12845 [Mycolicibacter virginiensis]